MGLAPSSHDILISYRHLYRALLHAVQFSMPARFTARDQLRDAFRKGDPTAFNQEKIDRTIQFLNLAASETGLEHRIVKNLLRTNYERRQAYLLQKKYRKPLQAELRKTSMIHYDMTVAMLNDTLGLCLR